MRCSGPTEQLLKVSLGFSIACLGFLVISVRSRWAASPRRQLEEDLENRETEALLGGNSEIRWQHGKRAAATLLGVFSLFMLSLGLYDAIMIHNNSLRNNDQDCPNNALIASFHAVQAMTWLLVAGVCSAPKAFRIAPSSFFTVRKILCLEFVDQSLMLLMVSLGLFVYDSSGMCICIDSMNAFADMMQTPCQRVYPTLSTSLGSLSRLCSYSLPLY